ncbi:MAG: hypothetical protein ACOX87_11210, partial [Chloroflexota bacterium]
MSSNKSLTLPYGEYRRLPNLGTKQHNKYRGLRPLLVLLLLLVNLSTVGFGPPTLIESEAAETPVS